MTKLLPTWTDLGELEDRDGDDNNQKLLKVVVIGESGAGKSNLIHRLIDDRFDARSKSTIGIDFALYEFEDPLSSGSGDNGNHCKSSRKTPPKLYKAQIWDTAGQERYRSSMTKIFYRDVAGAILVFDLTNREHFSALNRWYDEIRLNVHYSAENAHQGLLVPPNKIPILLVGNKVDEADRFRAVRSSEAIEFVRRHNGIVNYVETSAKTGHNVHVAFTALFEQILVQRRRAEQEREERALERAASSKHHRVKSKQRSVHKRNKSVQREPSIKLGYSNHYNNNNNDSSQYKAVTYLSRSSSSKKKQNKCNC